MNDLLRRRIELNNKKPLIADFVINKKNYDGQYYYSDTYYFGNYICPDASSSIVNLPNHTIDRYYWDYGDGSTISWTPTPNTFYYYHNPGTYNITLTVSMDNGLYTDTITKTIVVTERTLQVGCHLNNIPVQCQYNVGDRLRLYCEPFEDVPNTGYYWTGPNGWYSRGKTTSRGNIRVDMSGTYTCTITCDGYPTLSGSTEVIVSE